MPSPVTSAPFLLSSNRDFNLHTRLNVDNNLLNNLRRRIKIDQPLVNPHLICVPRLASLTTRGLSRTDAQRFRR